MVQSIPGIKINLSATQTLGKIMTFYTISFVHVPSGRIVDYIVQANSVNEAWREARKEYSGNDYLDYAVRST